MIQRRCSAARYLAALVLLAALYFAGAKLGLLAAPAQPVVSSAWPPAGVALAALLLFGLRLWPGIAVAAFALNASAGVPPAAAAAIAAGNTLEALVGAVLLARVARFRPSLERLRDVLALVLLGAVASTTVSASIGVGSLWLADVITPAAYGSLWLVWWSGDAMGVLVLAPLALTWAASPRTREPLVRAVEAAALVLALVLLTHLLFRSPFSYVYAVFPVASWAALRFGPRGAATAVFLVSTMAVWYTVRGLGPFVGSTPTQNLFLLQTFIALLTMTALVLAAVIGERRRAEEALRESEAHYRVLFESNPNPLWVYDSDSLAFLAVNEAAVRHYGYSREEFLGMTLADIRPSGDVARLRAQVSEAVPGFLQAGERRHRKKDGTVIDVDVTRHVLTFAGRRACLAMARDVTERKRVDETLQDRTLRQAAVVTLGHHALATADLPALFDEAVVLVAGTLGVEYCKVLELLPGGGELLLRAGVGWREGSVGRATVPAGFDSQAGFTLASDDVVVVQDVSTETRFTAPALLREHGVASGASVVIRGGDRPFGVLGAHSVRPRSLTEDDAQFLQAVANVLGAAIGRRRAEEVLRATQTRLHQVLASSATVIYAARLTGEISSLSYISENVTRIMGYGVAEALGPNWWVDHLNPEDRARVLAELPVLLAVDKFTIEYRLRHKDGTYRWMLDEARLLRDPVGAPLEVVGSWIDITERKRVEMRFSGLLEAAPDAMVIVGQDGRIALVNAQTESLFGYARADLLGKPVELLVPEHFRGVHPDHRAGYFRDPRARPMGAGLDLYALRKDGSEFPAEISLSPMDTGDGTLVTAAIRDITERKEIEEHLRVSQRLEAVGQLAAGIAHDFNNLLTAIIGNSELLLRDLRSGDPNREAVEEVVKAAGRAASLTRQLLAFSRRQILQPKVLDLNAVVTDMDKMLRRLIGEHIDLAVILDPSLGRVKADPGQLEQVILNLAVNARDAMPGGGKLTIETGDADLDEDGAARQAAVRPGRYVLLTVSDTGVGMDAETRAHIFEPFFTTKGKGRGTGLGLATVYGIAKQSGGSIWCSSEPGLGATFRVYLPRVEEVVDSQTASGATTKAPRGSETVLLVEDEEGVRAVAREVLHRSGYMVLEARNGDEAAGISRRYRGPIHLVLTDVVLPQLSGRDLAERLASSRPEVKILYMSGYTDDAIVRHGVLEPGIAFLQKPFSPDALMRKVREVLDGPPKR